MWKQARNLNWHKFFHVDVCEREKSTRKGKGSRDEGPKLRKTRPGDLRGHSRVLAFMVSEMGGTGEF